MKYTNKQLGDMLYDACSAIDELVKCEDDYYSTKMRDWLDKEVIKLYETRRDAENLKGMIAAKVKEIKDNEKSKEELKKELIKLKGEL